MAVISELAVNVVAKTSGLQKGMNQATGILGKFQRSANKLVGSLGPLQGALAGLSAGALYAGFIRTAAGLDVLAKTSRRIGTTAQHLYGLRHAANLSGVEVGTLETSLEKLNVNLGQAARGTGPAVKGLQMLGLEARQLIGLDTPTALGMIADRLNDIPNAAGRAAVAQELFGRGGLKMQQILAAGSKGIRSMTNETAALTQSFTPEKLVKVEAFNDAMSRLRGVITATVQQIVIDITPKALGAVETLSHVYGVADIFGNMMKGENALKTSTGILGAPGKAFTRFAQGRPEQILSDMQSFYAQFTGPDKNTGPIDRSQLMRPRRSPLEQIGGVQAIQPLRNSERYQMQQLQVQRQLLEETRRRSAVDSFSIP